MESKSRELPDGNEVRVGAGTVQVKKPGPRGQWISVADHAEAGKALVHALKDAIELARVAEELRFELDSDEIANRVGRGEIDPDEDFDTTVGLDELDTEGIANRIDEIPDEVLNGKHRKLPDGHDLLIEPGSVKVNHGGRWCEVADDAEACKVLARLIRAENNAGAGVAQRRRHSRAEAPASGSTTKASHALCAGGCGKTVQRGGVIRHGEGGSSKTYHARCFDRRERAPATTRKAPRTATGVQIRQVGEELWRATVFHDGSMYVCDYAPTDEKHGGDPETGAPTEARVREDWKDHRSAFRRV